MQTATVLIFGFIMMGATAVMSQGLPVNPARPFSAKTCDEARARYVELLAGSPLISAAETRALLVRASADVARLCGEKGRKEPC